MEDEEKRGFFDVLDLLEVEVKRTYKKHDERWRGFGTYGNVIVPALFDEALDAMRDAHGMDDAEAEKLQQWMEHQSRQHGSPDEAVAEVLIKYWRARQVKP